MSELLDSIASHAICDFLAWRGVGFRVPKKKQEDVIPLEKLNVVSANNQALINEFLNWMCSNSDYSESTYKVYRDGLKSFFEYSNEFNIEAAKRYIKSLEATGRKPSTIRLRINALEKFGEWLKKPIRLNRPKSHKKLNIENVPSESEYRRLLDYLLEKGDNYHYLWIRILASTGVRSSEFLQLRWEDIISGDVTLRCKGNKYRRILFSKSLQKEVSTYIKTTGVSGFVAVGKFGKITAIWISMAERRCIDYYRRYLSGREDLFHEDSREEKFSVPAHRVEVADILRHLRGEKCKRTMKLYSEGMTPTEIAKEMDSTRSTVSSCITRSILHLQKIYRNDIDQAKRDRRIIESL